MLRRDIPLPSFEGVAASSTATLRVPENGTYYQIDLEYRESGALVNEATLVDGVGEIRLLINGQIVRRHTAQDIIDLNEHYGIPFTDGYIHLFFWEPWADNAFSQEIYTWGMNDVRNFTIEVDLKAGASTPSMKAVAKKTLERKNLGLIRKINKYTVAVAGTGVTNYQTLPVADSYKALHCQSANVDDAEVIVNGSQIFKLTEAQMQAKLSSNPKLAALTSYFHINFDEAIRLEDFLPMKNYVLADGQIMADGAVSEFAVNFNMGSASSFGLLAETIGLVAG